MVDLGGQTAGPQRAIRPSDTATRFVLQVYMGTQASNLFGLPYRVFELDR